MGRIRDRLRRIERRILRAGMSLVARFADRRVGRHLDTPAEERRNDSPKDKRSR
ncbi:MAG: hypothetical protein ACRDJM_01420 [Actinomycetota bacterium]